MWLTYIDNNVVAKVSQFLLQTGIAVDMFAPGGADLNAVDLFTPGGADVNFPDVCTKWSWCERS